MTIYWKDRTKQLCLLFTAAILINSCKKEVDDSVGTDVIGNRSGFDIKVDTLDVITYSSKADSIDTRFLNYYLLGQINDPAVGKTSANLVTQYSIPFDQFDFEGSLIDSVVLQLRYAGATGIYGKNETPQTLRVYEITEDLPTSIQSDINGHYMSTISYAQSPVEVGSYTGIFNVKDSVYVNIGTARVGYAPQLRIKITDPSFVSRLQNASKLSEFYNEANFKAAFKGFMISADQQDFPSGGGALAYMYLSNVESALVIYTHKQEGTATVYRKYDFPVSRLSTVKANQYKHVFPPQVVLQDPVSGTNQSTCYVQGAAGIKTRIFVKGLAKLAENKPIAISNARLILTAKDTTGYAAATRLIVRGGDINGATVSIPDEFEAGYGGNFDATKSTYTFNVNRFAQNVVNTYYKTKTDVNYGLTLSIPYNDIDAARRVILNTDNSDLGDRKLKFVVTYTVIK